MALTPADFFPFQKKTLYSSSQLSFLTLLGNESLGQAMTSVRWLSRLPLTALPALPDGGWLVPFSWILGLVLDPLADLDADEVADGC